jgi:hypothetical protein
VVKGARGQRRAAGRLPRHLPHPGGHPDQAALALAGLPAGPVRAPLVDATEAQIATLKADRPGRRGARMTQGAGELPPPPLPGGGLRVARSAASGVGRNMTVFEHAGRLLVVVCGVLFRRRSSPASP